MCMKRAILSFSVLLCSLLGWSQNSATDTLRNIHQNAFKAGERLEYVLHYGLLNAGEAILEVYPTPKTLYGRELLHVVGIGKSTGAFNWFYKVRDRYESFIDKDGVFPWIFVRRVNEGGYKINQDYRFYQQKKQVDDTKGNTYDMPEYVQDMLSAFYFARTMNFDTAKAGDIFTVPSIVDGEYYPLKIKYQGKGTLEARSGDYRCLKFSPVVQTGKIFKDENDLRVWISDDPNKIPVMVEADILVGSIKMELTKYKGLAHPISKIN